jgi:hypothetical protein
MENLSSIILIIMFSSYVILLIYNFIRCDKNKRIWFNLLNDKSFVYILFVILLILSLIKSLN